MYPAHCKILSIRTGWLNQCPSHRDLWITKYFTSQEVRSFAFLIRLRKQQKSLLAPPSCTKLVFNHFYLQYPNRSSSTTVIFYHSASRYNCVILRFKWLPSWNAVCSHCLDTSVLCLKVDLVLFFQVTGNANSWNMVCHHLLHFFVVYTHAVRVPESHLANTQEFCTHSIKF